MYTFWVIFFAPCGFHHLSNCQRKYIWHHHHSLSAVGLVVFLSVNEEHGNPTNEESDGGAPTAFAFPPWVFLVQWRKLKGLESCVTSYQLQAHSASSLTLVVLRMLMSNMLTLRTRRVVVESSRLYYFYSLDFAPENYCFGNTNLWKLYSKNSTFQNSKFQNYVLNKNDKATLA